MVGCPVLNDLDSLKQMYYSLISSTTAFDQLVFVVGKGCNQETINFLESTGEEIIGQTQTPLEAYNKLFDLAVEREMDLFVTQTDVLFPKLYKRDWLEHMKSIATDERVGAITSQNGGKYSGPDYVDGFYWLGGWCTYYPLRALKKIGGYDKDFPNGFGVDIDHSYRLNKTGLMIVKMDYWVDHHMQNERLHDNDPNTEQMKKDSSKYFKTKWKL